jgi:type IV secretory pathway VirB10-like protein
MLSNKVAVGIIGVLALIGAAGAGAFLASRHADIPDQKAAVTAPSTTPAAGGAVEATEAVMDDKDAGSAAAPSAGASQPTAAPVAAPAPAPVVTGRAPRATPRTRPDNGIPVASRAPRDSGRTASQSRTSVADSRGEPPVDPVDPSRQTQPSMARAEGPRVPPVAELPPAPEYLEVTVPTDAVVGLQIETTVSSETARIEDRVVARVTRDVRADGRVAIPAGSRVLGAVSLVDRGGKMKEQARLGVRFHTVILADGTELPLQTETVYRVGEAPANASAAKVGGGAIGGAILGAILGGGKGAAIGGAIGAAGGTAAVMASERRPATLTAGSPVTVKVLSPVTVTVEKE